jgi:hypothetical protein
MHRRAAEIREVETIHKTLNVVLAEIDKLAPSVPVPAASMNCPHCGYAVGHADSCEYERFKPAAGSPAPSATGEATTPNPVVGHYTFSDGHHEPLLKSEADAFMAAADEARARRTAQMPDEQSAIHGLFDAWLRLKDLGWNDAIYCPKDGSLFDVIEPGSTGIHQCKYEGAWPTGSWWIVSDGDMCPSNPVLFRAVLPAQPREAK